HHLVEGEHARFATELDQMVQLDREDRDRDSDRRNVAGFGSCGCDQRVTPHPESPPRAEKATLAIGLSRGLWWSPNRAPRPGVSTSRSPASTASSRRPRGFGAPAPAIA